MADDLKLQAGLNIDDSVQKIKHDLIGVEAQLNKELKGKFKLDLGLDDSNAKTQIPKLATGINKQLQDAVKPVKIEFDNSKVVLEITQTIGIINKLKSSIHKEKFFEGATSQETSAAYNIDLENYQKIHNALVKLVDLRKQYLEGGGTGLNETSFKFIDSLPAKMKNAYAQIEDISKLFKLESGLESGVNIQQLKSAIVEAIKVVKETVKQEPTEVPVKVDLKTNENMVEKLTAELATLEQRSADIGEKIRDLGIIDTDESRKQLSLLNDELIPLSMEIDIVKNSLKELSQSDAPQTPIHPSKVDESTKQVSEFDRQMRESKEGLDALLNGTYDDSAKQAIDELTDSVESLNKAKSDGYQHKETTTAYDAETHEAIRRSIVEQDKAAGKVRTTYQELNKDTKELEDTEYRIKNSTEQRTKELERQAKILDSNEAFTKTLEGRIKDISLKAYDKSDPLKDTKSFDEMQAAIEGFENKKNKIVEGVVGEYSKSVKAQLGELVHEIDRTRQRLQKIEYPGTKLSADSMDNNIKKAIADLEVQDNKWKANGISVEAFKQKVEALYNTLTTDISGKDGGKKALQDWDAEFKVLIKTANSYLDITREINNTGKQLSKINAPDIEENFGGLKGKLDEFLSLKVSGKPEDVERAKVAYDELRGSIDGVKQSIRDFNSDASQREIGAQAEIIIDNLKQMKNQKFIDESQIENAKNKLRDFADMFDMLGAKQSQVTKFKDLFAELSAKLARGVDSTQNQDFIKNLESFEKQAKDIYGQKIVNSEQFDVAGTELKALEVQLKKVLALPLTGNQAQQVQNIYDKAKNAVSGYDDAVQKAAINIDKINNDIKDFIRNSSAAVQDPKLGPQIKALKEMGEAYAKAATPEKKNELANELARIKSEAKGAGLSVLSMGDLISATFKRLLSYNVANMFIGGIKTAVHQSIKDIKDIDNQLTQLSKVTDIVKEDFKELSIEALNSASRWGKTASDYLKSVETFAKAGKANYEALAEVSINFSRFSVNPEAQGCIV